MSLHVVSTWRRALEFEVVYPYGETQILASVPREEHPGPGASPVETVLGALSVCSGIDVVSILRKMRREPASLRIEVDGVRRDEEPRIFTEITLTYFLDGEVDVASARRAVELSQDKYCSVAAMLRPTAKLGWKIVLNGEALPT